MQRRLALILSRVVFKGYNRKLLYMREREERIDGLVIRNVVWIQLIARSDDVALIRKF